MELQLRLKALHIERNTLYAERHAHRINDESLRNIVAEIDLADIALRKRLEVARRTVAAYDRPSKAQAHEDAE